MRHLPYIARLCAPASGFVILSTLALLGLTCREKPISTTPEISARDLRQYVEALASPRFAGRTSGTAEGRAAAAFVAGEHRRNGLLPGFGKSFFQEFPFTAAEVTVTPGRNHLAVSRPGGTPALLDVLPLPLSKPGTFRGPLVFAGYCIEKGKARDDFAGLSVRDSIVVCLRFGPGGKDSPEFHTAISFMAKLDAAARRGARAVIFLGRKSFDAPSTGSFPTRQRPEPAAVYAEPEAFLKLFPKLVPAERAAEQDRVLPADTLGPMQATALLSTDFKQKAMVGTNVAAFLRKPTPGEKVLILGAHLDHIGRGEFGSVSGRGRIHPGADDNASGTAVLLELAAGLRARLDSFPKGANVLFVHFDAEERGLLGSRAFTKSPAFLKQGPLAMINLDMVGRLRPKPGLMVQGYDTADARFETAIRSAMGAALTDKTTIKLRRGGMGPSDHTAFYEKRVPVLFLTTGIHKEYHTSSDAPGLVNYDGMLAVLRLTDALLRELASVKGGGLAFRESGAGGRAPTFRPSLRLGIVPAGYGEKDGIEVGSVHEGAPVASAGLRPGDRVVALGGKSIADIYDLMDFLRTAKPNTEYAIEFTRGKERHAARTRLLGQ